MEIHKLCTFSVYGYPPTCAGWARWPEQACKWICPKKLAEFSKFLAIIWKFYLVTLNCHSLISGNALKFVFLFKMFCICFYIFHPPIQNNSCIQHQLIACCIECCNSIDLIQHRKHGAAEEGANLKVRWLKKWTCHILVHTMGYPKWGLIKSYPSVLQRKITKPPFLKAFQLGSQIFQ